MFGSCCGCGNRKAGRSKALSSTDEEDSSQGDEEVKKKKRIANGEENNGKISLVEKSSESQQLSKDPEDGNVLLSDETPKESAKGYEIVLEEEEANDDGQPVSETVTKKPPSTLEKVTEEDKEIVDEEEEEVEEVADVGEKIDENSESSEAENASLKQRHRSDASNVTVEESIVIRSVTRTSSVDEESSTSTTVTNRENSAMCRSNGNFHNPDDCSRGSDTCDEVSKSCLSRRSSSKSSMKKRVNYNASTEFIPPSDLNSINDDDEVFSDSIPPQLPRGDMCTPYLKKRGSMPGLVALPDWFNTDHQYREVGGVQEPPVTPIGRDELALKRHRFFSELLTAAQAAVEHRVRFDPLGPDVADDLDDEEDCDPNIKPSTAAELEALVVRLEKIVDRLERSVSARELAAVNQTLESVKSVKGHPESLRPLTESIERADCYLSKEESLDLDLPPPPPTPPPTATASRNFSNLSADLEERINNLESTVGDIRRDQSEEDVIPTVVQLISLEKPKEVAASMSVPGYEDIVGGSVADFVKLSQKIGGDVAAQANLVKEAFDAQLKYVRLATEAAQPPQDRQMQLLQPTSQKIAAIQEFREKHRTSPYFNHLSAISESIPALGWVCVSPTPGPHVKEMNDAGQFYTNRVLKDWKEKDATHVEWTRAWVKTLTDLQQYIKQHHTTGLVWSGKGQVPAGGCPPPPPPGMPPPPPMIPLEDLSLGAGNDDRSALFAEINRGEDITKNLKKVSADMQTHKNPGLRSGPAPFKAPSVSAPVSAPKAGGDFANKPPVFSRDGKKWLIEYQKSNPSLAIDNAEMNNVAYMFRCQDSTLTVKGKINSIVIDSCKKCSILFDSLVSSIEFVNCQSVQMQVLGKVPTISIDKTDGCQMYLSDQSLGVEIISSKSSEMNVLIPKGNGDYAEQPVPEQFKTTIKGQSLNTICVESLG